LIEERKMSIAGGNMALLHGMLQVKIIQADGLKNKDGTRFLKVPKSMKSRDLSDAYVTVLAGKHRLIKSKTVDDDLHPVWNETFFVHIAHYVSGLEFVVYDFDMVMDEKLGSHFLSVDEILKVKDGKPLRTGIHKVACLNNDVKNGTLHYYVEFVPAHMIDNALEVPGAYFKETKGNLMQYYTNADDIDDGSFPLVTYGGPDDNKKEWQPPCLWKDIYSSICCAQHFIYIAGWSVDTKISLLRDEFLEEAKQESKYSTYIGKLLKQKADEGVKVNLIIWDDKTTMMGVLDKETKEYFKGSNVNVVLAPLQGSSDSIADVKIIFTHHQKFVILDAERPGIEDQREPMAFMGGIDLTNGRYDNRMHPLFRTIDTSHKGDTYNQCFKVNAAAVGPRQPWRDIHSSIRGPGVKSLLRNFEERWRKQASNCVEHIVNLEAIGLSDIEEYNVENQWHTQLLRSIDSRTCAFDASQLQSYQETDLDNLDVEFEGDAIRETETNRGSFLKMMKKDKSKRAFDRTFVTDNADSFQITRDLYRKKGRDIDASIHAGLVHHIRRAKHFIYVESQYFLGNAHMWDKHDSVKCDNLVATEILLKICQKIEANERFAVYINIPMWPEGDPEGQTVQAILYWQFLTVQSMYKQISKVLMKNNSDLSPKDYLNFYCLGNREIPDGSTAYEPPSTPDEILLNKTRRHQIYIHSKMTIVDDAVCMIGSANINQRSLDGSRDSEIVLASYQPSHLATSEGVPHGEVHGFRLHVWESITNSLDDVFKDPSSLACVRRLNEIAEENWAMYTQEESVEMNSHLLPYPIEVDKRGNVFARSDLQDDYFPDTKAKVTGTYSSMLPSLLTT